MRFCGPWRRRSEHSNGSLTARRGRARRPKAMTAKSPAKAVVDADRICSYQGCGRKGAENEHLGAFQARSKRTHRRRGGRADPRSRRSGVSGRAAKGARGQFGCDRRGLGARRQGDCAEDRQPCRSQSLDPTGDEHLLRARSRAGRRRPSSASSRTGARGGASTESDRVPTPQPFRIQFMGAGPDSTPSVLREDEIRASDVSAAIIAAAIAAWPPHTIALRILDREGHEVFGRQKAAGR